MRRICLEAFQRLQDWAKACPERSRCVEIVSSANIDRDGQSAIWQLRSRAEQREEDSNGDDVCVWTGGQYANYNLPPIDVKGRQIDLDSYFPQFHFVLVKKQNWESIKSDLSTGQKLDLESKKMPQTLVGQAFYLKML